MDDTGKNFANILNLINWLKKSPLNWEKQKMANIHRMERAKHSVNEYGPKLYQHTHQVSSYYAFHNYDNRKYKL